jgi:hypothetical protein
MTEGLIIRHRKVANPIVFVLRKIRGRLAVDPAKERSIELYHIGTWSDALSNAVINII